jgi:hypothetical protein
MKPPEDQNHLVWEETLCVTGLWSAFIRDIPEIFLSLIACKIGLGFVILD